MKKSLHHLYQVNGTFYFVAKGVRKSLKTKDEKTAKKIRDAMLREVEYHGVDEYFKQVPAFGQVCQEWFDLKKHEDVVEETLYKYQCFLNNILFKAPFVSKTINEITIMDVELWWKKELKGCSANTINYYLTIVSQIFKFSRKCGYTTSSIMDLIQRPKSTRPKPDPFNTLEVDRIIVATPKHYKNFIITKLYSGVRISEICGLKWANVDFVRGMIQIRGRLLAGIEGRCKNTYSEREVQMLPLVRDALLNQRKATLGKSDYVFVNEQGKSINSKVFSNKVWSEIIKAADVRYRSFKETRHTFATFALDAGARPLYVSRQLGHCDTTMLAKHYQGLIDKAEDYDKIVAATTKNNTENVKLLKSLG